MAEVTIVSTSHIAGESLERVRKAINEKEPDCVAVELDVGRYRYFSQGREAGHIEIMKNLGVMSFLLYWVMKKIQIYFSRKTGILPGTEMVSAVNIARGKNLNIAFIDRPIEGTLLRMKNIPLGEKLGIFKMLLLGMLGLAVPSAVPLKKKSIDLNRVPPSELVEQAMHELKKRLPSFYRILVEERDRIMARNLITLNKRFERIVCVVGAGHEKGLSRFLERKH